MAAPPTEHARGMSVEAKRPCQQLVASRGLGREWAETEPGEPDPVKFSVLTETKPGLRLELIELKECLGENTRSSMGDADCVDVCSSEETSRSSSPSIAGKIGCHVCDSKGAGKMVLADTEDKGLFFCTSCFDSLPAFAGSRAAETKPGMSSSKSIGLQRCKECPGVEALGTPYAGAFYCQRCWDSRNFAENKGRNDLPLAVKRLYDHSLNYPRVPPAKVRLLERYADDTWKIERKSDHQIEDQVPAEYLLPESAKERVKSIEQLKGMLREMLEIEALGARLPPRLSVDALKGQIRKKFGCELDQEALGHKKLLMLLKDPALSGEFSIGKGRYILFRHPDSGERHLPRETDLG